MAQQAAERETAAKPSVFISYGRADAGDILADLARDLAAGWEVLYDKQFLRAGERWAPAIQEAIARSRIVIFILTPHSVREGDNPSVCHDELLSAQAARIPILPIMWRQCQLPLTLRAIQHIDFENLPYPDALAQLRARLDDIVAGKAVPRIHRVTEVWSLRSEFEVVLQNVRAAEFQGRDWLFAGIAKWRKSDNGARLLLVTGDPGTGKSAVAAHFAKSERCGPVLSAHFCGRQASTTLEPQNLVRNLAYVLAQRLPEYRDALLATHRQEALEQLARDGRGDLPIDDLLRLVVAPLRELANPFPPDATPAWLVIDGLDESAEYARARESSSIVDLLAAELPRVPSWLRILATSRPSDVPVRLARVVQDGRPLAHVIHISKEDSAGDITGYIEHRAKQSTVPLTPDDKQHVVEKAAGNFLCVKLVLDGLFAGTYRMADIRRLPPGLAGFYSADFSRLFGAARMEAYLRQARPLLAVAVAAQDDLSADALGSAAALEPDDVHAELRRLAAYLSQRNARYSVFHKSLSDWLCDRSCADDFAVNVKDGHAALAALCWKRFGALPRARIRGLNELAGNEISEYLVRFGVDHLVGGERLPEAIEVLHFITAKSRQTREPAKVFADVVPGRFKRRVLRGLKTCPQDDRPRINAALLKELVIDFYQVEPLEAPIRILLHDHPAQWEAMQQAFVASDNYVLRYVVSEAVADACIDDDDPAVSLDKIHGYMRHADVNFRELGAYALRHVYGAQPERIDPEYLELMADSDTYAGRSALGDLMLTLTFQEEPDLPVIRSRSFWEPIWDHNCLDVWDLKAADAFLANGPPPDDADARIAYDNFVATEGFRRDLAATLAAASDTDGSILKLVTRDGFASLARSAEQIGEAEDALSRSSHLVELMRLFFAHPLWAVAETAASVLASVAEKDFQKRSIVAALFDDPYWRVCFGAIETAYQLIDFDRFTLFRDAVKRFYGHESSRVRALCAENLIAYMLDCAPAARERYLEEFDAPVRRWIDDDDAWVLEHVFRLLRRLDQGKPGCARYFAGQAPYLLQGLPDPLPQAGWSKLSRADFLAHIERRQRERVNGPVGTRAG
jgi:hypothetical protein